jgi:hypothetical protein
MPYNNSQPLGSTARGGGGGWKALQLIGAMGKAQPASTEQQAALKGGAGPVSKMGAEDYLRQRQSSLGLGSSVYDRVNSDVGFQNSMAGYTAGTGAGKSASGNSY